MADSVRLVSCAVVLAVSVFALEWRPAYAEKVSQSPTSSIGREVAIPRHLPDGAELRMSVPDLVAFGRSLFTARWTVQEGQGRPLTKGNGLPLTDAGSPLTFPRNFNRISGPDTGGCAKCHNRPIAGGGGDISGNVFVLGDRFDFVTFGNRDPVPTRGAVDETRRPVTLQSVANSRKVVGMFGAGYVEMLARQITSDLQMETAGCRPGATCPLSSKGISFGSIRRRSDGSWDVAGVTGLAAPSLSTSGQSPPPLIVRPFNQAGAFISLRQFTNGAFNQHHGIQSEERFGLNVDADGDGFVNELTRADMTAVTLFQATLAVPGQVISRDPAVEAAVARGAQVFGAVGCGNCHIPQLPLVDRGWTYSEPNPFNPPGNLQVGTGVPSVYVDLSRSDLPQPRLPVENNTVMVPAYTDLKLHDITGDLPSCWSHPDLIASGQCDGDAEPMDQNETPGTAAFFAGNRRFVTRKLWGIANQHAFGHHGEYTTMREAVMAHAGEAKGAREALVALPVSDQDALIEFLKSLQILPPNTPCLVVDETYACR